MPGPANPHDALFKRVFSDPKLAAGHSSTATPGVSRTPESLDDVIG